MNACTITKYGRRFWAVHDSAGALICLCVYKRGAVEVARRCAGPAVSYLALHEAAPAAAPVEAAAEAAAQKSLETLGPSPEATLESLTIRMDQTQQQQHT